MFGLSSLVTTLVLITVLPVLLLWLGWRWRNRRLLELAAKVPGPPALPIIGNALMFMTKPYEHLNLMQEIVTKYGEISRFWLGPELNIIVSNPSDVKLLLSSNKINQKGPLYEFMKPMADPGILVGGEVWRHRRKVVTPSYNKKNVAAFARVFNMEASSLAQQLCSKKPGETFNVYFDAVNCTTQCVCQTLMGLSKTESQSLPNLDYVVFNTRRMYSFFYAKMTKWWLRIPLVYWLTGAKKEEKELIRQFYILFNDIVDKRTKALERKEEVDEDVRGIVDRLIHSGELTEQQIVRQTFVLFTTSQEAGAKIVSAVLLFLAHLPEWQDKVYNEILDRLGPEDEFITEEHIKSLQYLDMVYKEVLRYLSIAAVIQRTVEEEVTIGNLTLPAGTALAIPIHIFHRNPKIWPEPNKVDPGRFLPENVKARDPNAFIPYSLGPMDCLGRVYAVQMVKTMVVRVLRHVRFEADGRLEDLELDNAISVSFLKGYNLRTYPRKPKSTRIHHVA